MWALFDTSGVVLLKTLPEQGNRLRLSLTGPSGSVV